MSGVGTGTSSVPPTPGSRAALRLISASTSKFPFQTPDDLSYAGMVSQGFPAALRAPWLNTQSRVAEWGFHCVGCPEEPNLQVVLSARADIKPRHFGREFLVSTFEQHLREFGPVRDGMHHADGCCEEGTCLSRNWAIGYKPYWKY
jgi:hypothetical protein